MSLVVKMTSLIRKRGWDACGKTWLIDTCDPGQGSAPYYSVLHKYLGIQDLVQCYACAEMQTLTACAAKLGSIMSFAGIQMHHSILFASPVACEIRCQTNQSKWCTVGASYLYEL